MIKSSVHQQDIMIPNTNTSKKSLKTHEAKADRVKVETDKPINTVGGLQPPPLAIDRTTSQKLSEDTEELNNTITQQDLTDVDVKNTVPKKSKYAFFSSVHGAVTRDRAYPGS